MSCRFLLSFLLITIPNPVSSLTTDELFAIAIKTLFKIWKKKKKNFVVFVDVVLTGSGYLCPEPGLSAKKETKTQFKRIWNVLFST